ncbi:MAG: uncharacterized protein JWN95_3427 [Frankiales bacterium]|nr:uncharacterized protein [Frankiales bacterium]
MARRKEKRTEQSKLDATPPWDTRRVHESAKTVGPYDVLDAPEDGRPRLDLGALRVVVDAGLEVRVDIAEQGQVAGVTLANDSGQMQLGVYAAPRSEGIWDEVRAEIKASISSQGGTVEEQDGDFGTELAGKLPAPGGFTPVRFIGVNGPRWFLRGMLSGAPALAKGADGDADVFLEAFRTLVVVRGNEALPVREPVPLVLPEETAEQINALAAESDDGTALGNG